MPVFIIDTIKILAAVLFAAAIAELVSANIETLFYSGHLAGLCRYPFDLHKLMRKEATIPIDSNRPLFILAPVLMFSSVSAVLFFVMILYSGYDISKADPLTLYAYIIAAVFYALLAAAVSRNNISIYEARKKNKSLMLGITAFASSVSVPVIKHFYYSYKNAPGSLPFPFLSPSVFGAFIVFGLIAHEIIRCYPYVRSNTLLNSEYSIDYSGPLLGIWILTGTLMKTLLCLAAAMFFICPLCAAPGGKIAAYFTAVIMCALLWVIKEMMLGSKAKDRYLLYLNIIGVISVLIALLGL